MSTTSPPWLPTWLTSFPDLGALYRATVPRQFPEGLYDEASDTDESKDVRSVADVFGVVAQAAHWIRACIAPQNDSQGLFLSLWETCLGIAQAGTTTLRQNAITAAWRTRWTMTHAAATAVFRAAYGYTGNIIFTVPTTAEIAAHASGPTDYVAYRKRFQMLITPADDSTPYTPACDDEARKRAPAWEQWTCGTKKLFTWDDPDACWGRSVWS